MKYVSKEFIAFIAVGLANTFCTYLLYIILLKIISYVASFSIAYVTGIAISYVLNSMIVFRKPLRWHKGLCFPFLYAILYAFGLILLQMLVECMAVNPYVAPLIVIAVNIPLSFFLCRLVIVG